MNFTYVYILQSEANPDRFYVGLTDELQERLRKHNAGEVSHTAKFKPWVLKTAIAFRDRKRAACIRDLSQIWFRTGVRTQASSTAGSSN